MRKKVLFMALSALALASCSNDEMIEVQQDEIKFAVTAESTTRAVAGAVATTTNSIKEFKVWAYTTATTPQLYINGEVYTRTEATSAWNDYNTEHFWPSDNLNFYAISPATPKSGTVSIEYSAQKITNYTASGNEDLLYSVKKNQVKQTDAVALNFRHALSQIVFKAKNTNSEKLGVAINGVKIVNVYQTNSELTLPTVNTDDHLSTDNSTTTETDSKWGTWKNDGYTSPATYEAAITEVKSVGEEVSALTTQVSSADKGLLLLPQTLDPWDISTDADNSEKGSYFLVSCKVWNITGDETQDADPVYLHGSKDAYADVAIPTTAITWKQGMKYVYTFIFGEGAGYVPPTDEDEKVTPVLVPIILSVTVDEFQSATATDVDMSTTTDATTEGGSAA